MNYHPYSLCWQYYDKQTLSLKEGIKEYAAKSCRKMLLDMSVHEKQAFLNWQFLTISLFILHNAYFWPNDELVIVYDF